MAAAVTLHAPPSQSSIIPPTCSPKARARAIADFEHLISDKYTSIDAGGTQGPGVQCDGCKTRNSRCALNLAAKKCYSCDFHRQDCVFTPNTSRKRSCPQPASHSERKSSHARNRSLSSSFQDLLQSPMSYSSESAFSNASYPSTSTEEDASRYLYLRGLVHLDPLLLEHFPFDEENDEASLGSARFRKIGKEPSEFMQILTSSPAGGARQATATQLLNNLTPANTNLLVQRYFKDVHPIFPILDRETFWESYENRCVEPLLLTAVCLVSGAWLASTGTLQKEVSVSISELSVYEQLRSALERPNMSVLQAGLLLLQDPVQRYRQLSFQVISGAFDLGLHQDCSQWSIPQGDKRVRRRLAWALYAQDKWQALFCGRPAQISGANWLVKPLSAQDFEVISCSEATTSPQPRHSAALFIAMMVLSQLLADILDTFYTLSAEREIREKSGDGLRMVLERAKPVQIRLKDWFSNLSPCLRMDAAEEEAGCNGTLHLSYFAAEFALHQCIIRATVLEGTDSYLAHICRSAAKTRLISAMDFVNRLRPSHFQYAWPFASVSNFALVGTFGVLLQVTAPTEEEAGFYHTRLDEYRWTLAVSRSKASFLDSASNALDNSTELLQHVPNKPGIDEFMSTNPRSREHSLPSPHAAPSLSRPFTGFSSPDSLSSGDQEPEMMESE